MKNSIRITQSAAVVAGALSLTACGGPATAEPQPAENSKAVTDLVGEAVNDTASEIEVEETYTDVEFVTALRKNDIAQSSFALDHLDEARQAIARRDADGVAEHLRWVVMDYDYLVRQVYSMPEAETPLGQETLETFEQCRDAYSDSIGALKHLNSSAWFAATSHVRACNVHTEALNIKIEAAR